jgi:hypothetical protein
MVDPSLKVSIAVNCWVPLTGTEAVAGVTTNEIGVAAFTVKLAVAGECGLVAKVAVMTTGTALAVTPVARPGVAPPVKIVAPAVLALQVEAAVLSKLVPSLNVSTAVYRWVPVTGIEAVAGETTNDVDVALFTVKLAVAGECGLAAKVAVMTTGTPAGVAVTPVARPGVAPPVKIVALGLSELQVEAAVLSKLVPSLNVSIAVYRWVPVTGIDAVAGVTTNDVDVALLTVKLAVAGECGLAAKVAVMTTGTPAGVAVTPVARPGVAPPVRIVALALLAVHVEVAVLSKLVPSLNVSIAEYRWVPVTGIEAVIGVTTKDTDVAAFTVKFAVPNLPLKAAVMTTGTPTGVEMTPVARPVADPTVALPLFEDQVEAVVTSRDDPSLYIAVAVNCWLPVTGTEAVAGVTAMEFRIGTPMPKIGSRPPPPPQPAAKAVSINTINQVRNLERSE